MQILKVVLVLAFFALMILCGSMFRNDGPTKSSAPNPNAVQGWDASRDLAKQLSRSQEVIEEAKRLIDAGDDAGTLRVFRLRIAELNVEITRIHADTSYSVADKQKMLRVLEQERIILSSRFAY